MDDGIGLSGLRTEVADTKTPRHATKTTAFMLRRPRSCKGLANLLEKLAGRKLRQLSCEIA
eukprot:1400454-Pyramimonas_sp.AAC.1